MARRVPIIPAADGGAPAFQPWMGAGYQAARAASLAGESACCDGLWHVMGESHYGDGNEAIPPLTQRVMRDLAIPGYRFFDTVLAVAADKPIAELDREGDWSRFAFSNFVQTLLTRENRRPGPADWQSGKDAFFAQLRLTRPKQLLVVGRQQWDQLPL